MEVLVLTGIIASGYFLNKDGLQRKKKVKIDNKIPKEFKPNGVNIYDSNRVLEIRKDEQIKADKLFKKTDDSENTNVFIAGPPEPIFNKVDYSDKRLPIEFNDRYDKGSFYSDYTQDINNQSTDRLNNQKAANQNYITGPPTTGGFNGIETTGDYGKIQSLTGEMVNPKAFVHNNMTPFFGGSIKQNVDDISGRQVFENFTGQSDNYRKKVEIEPMFEPKANLGNVNGMQNFSQNNRDRYYVSNIMNNVKPVQEVRVGPGLNKGYTSQPSGGVQQANTRDYTLPKTVDELRVKTKPKSTYYGRIIAGESISRPGKIGTVSKNNPDTFFIHGKDRLFTTVGSCSGAKQRPKIVLKHSNRKTTELKSRIGPAGPVNGTKHVKRGKTRITRKVQYGNAGMRNADASGTWKGTAHDYGKKRIRLIKTNRQTTGIKPINKNLQNVTGSKLNMGNIKPKLRRTRKTNVTGNPRWASNVQAPHNRHKVYDPNDVARTTIKETTINNEREGNISTQQPSKPRVYDPNDVARTTIKETTIDNERDGNISTQQPSKPRVYDPNDIARTTIKETTINDDRFGGVSNTQLTKNYVKDKNDVAKPTMKQTTIDNDYLGPAIAPDTMFGGYQTNEHTAPTTHRETMLTGYVGDANIPGNNGYQIANVDMKNTARQFTTTDYTGGAVAHDSSAPSSRTEYDNATTTSNRQDVSKGRAPPPSGSKNYISGKDINAKTSKDTGITNKILNERGIVSTRVINSLPQPDKCGVTHEKKQLPNKPIDDRLDPAILNAFRENPYTKSLHSYAFN